MSALSLTVAGAPHGAPAPGLAPRDDRGANKESGDVFASLLDGTTTDSADAGRTLSGQGTKDSDSGPVFFADASLSRGADDWVGTLTRLSIPAGLASAIAAAPEKQETQSGPAVDVKARGGDKLNRAAAQDGRLTDGSSRARDQAGVFAGASAPTIKGLFEAAAPIPTKETQAKRESDAKGDASTKVGQQVARLVTVNPDGDLSGGSAASLLACALGSPSGVSAIASDAKGQDRSAAPSVAGFRPGAVPNGCATRATDEMAQGGLTPAVAPTRIVVTSQATWLAPVRAEFALKDGAATSDGAGHDRSPSASRQVEVGPAAQTEAPLLADAALASQGPHASGPAGVGNPRAASPAAATSNVGFTPEAPAPRRDLEVVLAPHDLGGLSLRLKSIGDRLEIAFVADKADTARMIDDRSATLESQLRNAGLGSGGVAISVAERPEDGAVSSSSSGHGSFGESAAGASQDGRQQRDATSQRHDLVGQNKQDFNDESRDNASEASGRRGDRGLYL